MIFDGSTKGTRMRRIRKAELRSGIRYYAAPGQRTTAVAGIGNDSMRSPTGSMRMAANSYAAGLPPAPHGPPTVLVGEREHRLYVLNPANVEYIQAQGNYVKLYTSDADYISRDSIKRLDCALADQGFLRIERSLMVNIGAIAYVQRAGQSAYLFTLHSGASLRSGARYRRAILRVIPLTQPPR